MRAGLSLILWGAALVLLAAICAAPAQAARPRLAWAPPSLDRPATVRVTPSHRELWLDRDKDYVVRMPSRALTGPGGLIINGGHDIRLIGGEIKLSGGRRDERQGRCLATFNATGVVHVEGLWCHGPSLAEGIQNYSKRAVLQVQNVRMDGVGIGSRPGDESVHSDLVQFLEGRELRVDRLTGSSGYQGIFVDDQMGEIRRADLRRVQIAGGPGSEYLLWRGKPSIPLALKGVYLQPASGRSLVATTWGASGAVAGRPPGRDFVPQGEAGVDYRSPGYAKAP